MYTDKNLFLLFAGLELLLGFLFATRVALVAVICGVAMIPLFAALTVRADDGGSVFHFKGGAAGFFGYLLLYFFQATASWGAAFVFQFVWLLLSSG